MEQEGDSYRFKDWYEIFQPFRPERNGINNNGLEEWKSERMEKWENKKYLVFPRVCLVGEMKKWEGGKLFYLVEKKSGRIENVVKIN